MFTIKSPNLIIGCLIFLVLISLTSCQPAANTNSNANVNANTNANSNIAAGNANMSSENAGVIINTREPDKYSSTLVFTIQTEGGEKAIGVPSLSIGVARNGNDRRVEFKLPDGTPLVYLDHDNHHYVIVPSRKQYAELTPEATGFQMHKMLTPGRQSGVRILESEVRFQGLDSFD